MKCTNKPSSKTQSTFTQGVIKVKHCSYKVPSKIVICPVFIDQDEERLFAKRANECMGRKKYLTIENT